MHFFLFPFIFVFMFHSLSMADCIHRLHQTETDIIFYPFLRVLVYLAFYLVVFTSLPLYLSRSHCLYISFLTRVLQRLRETLNLQSAFALLCKSAFLLDDHKWRVMWLRRSSQVSQYQRGYITFTAHTVFTVNIQSSQFAVFRSQSSVQYGYWCLPCSLMGVMATLSQGRGCKSGLTQLFWYSHHWSVQLEKKKEKKKIE